MNAINQKLQHQVEVMRAQKDIELSGPIEQVNNYIQALSRIYEIAEEVGNLSKNMDDIKLIAKGGNEMTCVQLTFSMGQIYAISLRDPKNNH